MMFKRRCGKYRKVDVCMQQKRPDRYCTNQASFALTRGWRAPLFFHPHFSFEALLKNRVECRNEKECEYRRNGQAANH